MRRGLRINQAFFLLALVAGTAVALGFRAARASGGAALAVDPAAAYAGVGWETTVAITLDGAPGTQGADVTFSFDPALVEVVDADGGAAGVQLAPGDCPAPGFVALNSADNGAGTGRYAAVSLAGTCAEGTVFSAALRCLAEGTSPLTIEQSTIADTNGTPIPHTTFSGSITCLTESIYLPLVMRE